MNLEFIKPQNLGPWLMKSSQSNFNLQSPSSYLARSYLIATVKFLISFLESEILKITWFACLQIYCEKKVQGKEEWQKNET